MKWTSWVARQEPSAVGSALHTDLYVRWLAVHKMSRWDVFLLLMLTAGRMGMALGRSNGDYFGVSYSLWSAMLELAERWGWRPAGTVLSEEGNPADWGGSYYSSDGQKCQDEDARGLAEALDRFLKGGIQPESSVTDDEERKRLRQFLTGVMNHLDAPLCHPINEADAWLDSADGREFVRKFIEFCRGGEFELW